MANKNCSRCKCYKNSYGTWPDGYIFISENEDSCLGKKYAICENGNNEIMKKWWIENGDKNPKEAEDLFCYIATEFDIALDEILDTASKLLDKTRT